MAMAVPAIVALAALTTVIGTVLLALPCCSLYTDHDLLVMLHHRYGVGYNLGTLTSF